MIVLVANNHQLTKSHTKNMLLLGAMHETKTIYTQVNTCEIKIKITHLACCYLFRGN
jgi:hypothetical protein